MFFRIISICMKSSPWHTHRNVMKCLQFYNLLNLKTKFEILSTDGRMKLIKDFPLPIIVEMYKKSKRKKLQNSQIGTKLHSVKLGKKKKQQLKKYIHIFCHRLARLLTLVRKRKGNTEWESKVSRETLGIVINSLPLQKTVELGLGRGNNGKVLSFFSMIFVLHSGRGSSWKYLLKRVM